ncbi:hypothetical protein AB8S08_05285 [Pseudidiomarina sp. PP-1MA]|uniref:DUF4304 domain-containing protein n=1 Tax=Pseudidiomarina sp. PP-1MA TaxID=3237706 RepID=A0AB39XCX4_9GAMM|nr:hypothetical protein [uncultured Pseudoalteromonas sp.]|tara:strand:- start:2418 stop:3038 length:621 start_codon:yes stop_codon:yes gene_type:complete
MSGKLVPMGKLLSDTCISLFKEIGFKKKKEGIFYKQYGDDLYLRIGFNESDKSANSLVINPMFGVGWRKLESFLTECNKGKYSPYLYASFSSNIGGFDDNNDVVKFTFERDSIIEDAQSFQGYLNFISLKTEERFANHSDLLDGLLRYTSVRQQQEKLACYHFLLGDKSKALNILDKERERLSSAHPVMQEEFEMFANEFKSKVTS